MSFRKIKREKARERERQGGRAGWEKDGSSLVGSPAKMALGLVAFTGRKGGEE